MGRNVSGILLKNAKGEILLQQKTDDAPVYPGKWCMFGGSIEKGETPLQAAIREFKEELDYTLATPRFVHKGPFEEDGTIHVFMERHDPSKKLTLHEGKAMKWVSPERSLDLDLVPDIRKTILDSIEKIKRF